MTELKPCPFCGGQARIDEYMEMISKYVLVMCDKCGAKTRGITASVDYCAKDKAVEIWNMRATAEEDEE